MFVKIASNFIYSETSTEESDTIQIFHESKAEFASLYNHASAMKIKMKAENFKTN